MADLVFQNKRALDQLENIVHEDVINHIVSELDEAAKKATCYRSGCSYTCEVWFFGPVIPVVGSELC